MRKILFLDGNLSANEVSYSRNIMDAFYQYTLKNFDKDQVERINLNDTKLSSIFLTQANFKTYFADVESDFWIDKLKEIDTLVISCSMTNFGPTVLVKNFIDSICVANKTFSYKYSTKGDAIGLLTNLNVIVVATQGAPRDWYPFGSHIEWLKGTFNFLGAKSVQTIEYCGTKVAPILGSNPKEISNTLVEQFSKINDLN
ncbi:FMN-dependent NADH-azoreductase [Mycoplasma sp. NEAQ87857]|uniref:FMN-dependent NADH-azoreductase n=1 Tax=Mycoplasma sp. NEAQ87857 TaxID=2683967 RepID=UPI00131684CD|nr:FMN-dependent NADH-azoreductase [Mycoplasma sp. NEAQ87857]QGZ97685.1 FMN-dependent NADH-azoreductase [Mycoplasma sp. NEAQ87857]